MEKNKDWCSFPDEAISQLKEHHAKNAGFNAKACTVAAKMKKMKEQAAQGAAARRLSRCRPDRFDRRAAASGAPAGRPAGEPGPAADPGFRPSFRSARPSRPARSDGSFCSRPAGRRRRSRALPSIAGPNLWHLALFLDRRDRHARRGLHL